MRKKKADRLPLGTVPVRPCPETPPAGVLPEAAAVQRADRMAGVFFPAGRAGGGAVS
ncbi:hypothetical protein CI610_00355 [invertebrate metagenome]|uniref:Uncharacterized protein n=1 Tax=invertebrate metagenome TaxID=1711999 RepID=A0A2H9TBW2_9ZZZZ